MDRTLFHPIFVHCHECQIRTNPSGTAVLSGGARHAVPPENIARLCIAVRSRRGASYLLPPGVQA